jgi:hypothetical protein
MIDLFPAFSSEPGLFLPNLRKKRDSNVEPPGGKNYNYKGGNPGT